MSIANIDDEWLEFLTYKPKQEDEYDEELDEDNKIDEEEDREYMFQMVEEDALFNDKPIPEANDIYISTKSKIAFLKNTIDLTLFWNIPVIPYSIPINGVIKKQIKLQSKTPEELNDVENKLKNVLYCEQQIITHIDNPEGRIKFKDIRKITIGVSKKDIMSYRSKKKQAFYNCFVMILRIRFDASFKEFHIKVFNTGKIEIPGVQNNEMFSTVLEHIINILQPFHEMPLEFSEHSDTVLINSNFNCGFYINREVLCDILKQKYNLQVIYDPCSYPGIQCKFYYNSDVGVQTGVQIKKEDKEKYKNIQVVSFMIFRTGSVLISGKISDEYILHDIYNFLKALLKSEFKFICQKIIPVEELQLKDAKKKKVRRKTTQIMVEHNVIKEEELEEEA
jgi:TATA-box binding protein (TBP) (component of TFIID and TFIIIB)